MFEILKNFESKYNTLKKKGLRIEGLSMIDPKRKKHVIMISKPFLFDNRQLPKIYEGLEIKSKIEGGLPEEFKFDKEAAKKEYLWAPAKFEKYVDRCSDEIRKQFGNPNMSRQEMLDALAFGNFEEHKKKSLQLMKEGKIPPFKLN
ncbi:MAG TPA: hypothetical protein PLC65_18610 [Bacteroidia bacterium]|nr:hypothetical protein [Bacteroidia bacterium]MBN8692186.1 hypothetical protein [Bacteroidota bacterium]HRD40648.1 hypothetical protein [Bacteroidia bacterium]